MKKAVLVFLCAAICRVAVAAPAAAPASAPIHAQGRHFVDAKGDCVRMTGVMLSIHPFFSGGRWGGGRDEDAAKRAVEYCDKLCSGLADRKQGCYCNMVRWTDDGHWSWSDEKRNAAKARFNTDKPADFYSCDYERYKSIYLEKVLVPIVENTVKHGLYAVIRPAYNNPGDTFPGCDFQRHLMKEWTMMASHPRLQALAGMVIFEIQNEPTNIRAPDGSKCESATTDYMQPLLDVIRQCGFTGPVIVPGPGYQSWYEPFMRYPMKDPLNNFGYAVHVYPGWYTQNDETADGERFIANFLRQVPVVMDFPCVVTEVDWSPVKPGKGKTNEFGEHVDANWGTWGTGMTSKWGNAYLAVLEKFGNVSTICGDGNLLFDIDTFLKSGKLAIQFGGEPECSPRAMWDLYARWGKAKPEKPAQRDRDIPRELEGEEVPLKTVKHLTQRFFRLSVDGSELNIATNGNWWDFQYSAVSPVGRNPTCAHLFKAHERVVDGKTHYALKCYRNNGVLRLSACDHQQGDSLCWSPHGRGFIEGSSRPKHSGKQTTGFDYGQDADYDGLWDIEAVNGGFTFRNVASRKYLGDSRNPHSDSPVVWQATTRAVRHSSKTGTRAEAARAESERPAVRADDAKFPVARFRRFSLDGAQDDFTWPFLDESWCDLGPTNCVWRHSAISKGRGLAIDARPFALNDPAVIPSFLFKEHTAQKFTAAVALSFSPRSREDFAGLAVYAKENAYYVLGKTKDSAGRNIVALVKSESSGKKVVATASLKKDSPVMLKVERKGQDLRFAWSVDGKKWLPVGNAQPGSILGAKCRIGLYATSAE